MIFKARLQQAFALYNELANLLDESSYGAKLPGLPSNNIGSQLWCVVGARESYLKAMQNGAWAGFTCSLPGSMTANKQAVSDALRQSADSALTWLENTSGLSESQQRLAFEWLEHEIQHHGQLIRYLYALKLGIPPGWKSRYHLD
jgi:hypothetical protein